MESIYTVNCLDKPDTSDLAQTEAFAQKLSQEAPIWGRSLAWGNVPCTVWPIPATGKSDPIAAPGSPPIVIVGTTRDPATPYESATQLRRQLAHGVLVHAGRGRPRRLSPVEPLRRPRRGRVAHQRHRPAGRREVLVVCGSAGS